MSPTSRLYLDCTSIHLCLIPFLSFEMKGRLGLGGLWHRGSDRSAGQSHPIRPPATGGRWREGKCINRQHNQTHSSTVRNTEATSMCPGAASVSGHGGVPPRHAPHLSGVCGRHDPAGGPDRGQPPAQPAAETPTEHHLREELAVSRDPSHACSSSRSTAQ